MPVVPVVPRLCASQIERRAEQFLQRYSPGTFQNGSATKIEELFELTLPKYMGIHTGYRPLKDANAYGLTTSEPKQSWVDAGLADSSDKAGRRFFRSTVSHEIGHCILHLPVKDWQQSLHMHGILMKREQKDIWVVDDPEWQAWRFAQAVLMPEAHVRQFCTDFGPRRNILGGLSETFDVNPAFVKVRLRALKIPY